MRIPDNLPTDPTHKITLETQPMKRHRTARYYAYRVHESLSTRISKLICAVFLALLLLIGVITFILWLSLRPHRPHLHLEQFSIPGLTRPASRSGNADVTVNVTIRNPNLSLGIYYDSVNGSVFYKDEMVGYGFYQGPKNTTVVIGRVGGAGLTVDRDRWGEILSDRGRGTVMFRLELLSTVRFKVSSWIFKRHRLHANCDVGVGPDGFILSLYADKRCSVYFT